MTRSTKRPDLFHKPTGDEVVHDRILTVPNLVTVARLLCIPVFVWLLFGAERRFAAAVLLAVLGATDWVDGYLARLLDQGSEVGRVLDPTVDRIMFIVAIGSMLIDKSVAIWFAVAVLAREVLVALAALVLAARGVRTLDVTWWGKIATFGLMFAFPLFLASHADTAAAGWYEALGWAIGVPSLALSWYSAAGYVGPARQAFRQASIGP